jgi:hypothetical protein
LGNFKFPKVAADTAQNALELATAEENADVIKPATGKLTKFDLFHKKMNKR